jgi:hypothetical protein
VSQKEYPGVENIYIEFFNVFDFDFLTLNNKAEYD